MPALCAVALLLAGCGASDNDPGGVTVGEARALDQAAEMLDHQRLPERTSPSSAPLADETPEAAQR